MNSLSVTIQLKFTQKYFRQVMFVILYKVVLCCERVDELKLVPERGKDAQKD